MNGRINKRKSLIKRLFIQIANETLGKGYTISLKLTIVDKREYSTCRTFINGSVEILLGLGGLERRVKIGYPPDYYKSRPGKVNKYIIGNRHNTLRFILYHELRHTYQRINNWEDIEGLNEMDADTWALEHLEARV